MSSQHHPENIISDPNKGTQTRSYFKHLCAFSAFVSLIEPKDIKEAIKGPDWIITIHSELNEFERNKVWDLVERPLDGTIMETRWVFCNKLNEDGEIIRNKTRLVAQDYNQEEGIDYYETFAPVARLESTRIMLTFALYMDIKLYQMDVKCTFLNGYLQEEVYVIQTIGFQNANLPNDVFKVNKALYSLKRALRVWYDRFSSQLLENNFQ